MTHIDRRIRSLLLKTPPHRRAGVTVSVMFDWTGDTAPLVAFGFHIGSYVDGIVSADIPLSKIEDVHDLKIAVLEMGANLTPTLDLSRKATKADVVASGTGLNHPYTGKGVIIGIVDSGIDYAHPSFRDASGKSRILFLWDQTESLKLLKAARHSKYRGALPRGFVSEFQYGVEYNKADLDAALATPTVPKGKPAHLTVVRQQDAATHGTHVAGIAAGNGRTPGAPQPTAYVGVAPEADLIIVKYATRRGSLGNNPKVADAIRYIASRAAQLSKNCVLNISLGYGMLPGDGKTRLERTIDKLIAGVAPGTAIVASAGNNAKAAIRARGTVPFHGRTELKIEVGNAAKREIEIGIWYGRLSAPHRFGLTLTPPSDTPSDEIGPEGGAILDFTTGPASGNTASILGEVNNPDHAQHSFLVSLEPGSAACVAKGVWTITLFDRGTGGGTSARPFDADLSKKHGARFANNVLAESMMDIPATAEKVISVASHVTRVSPTGSTGPATPTIAESSSRGPTPDGRKAPTISAPGEYIFSARPLAPKQKPYVANAGTSMAAPHVTGAIALMLEAKPTLVNSDIAKILKDTAEKPAGMDAKMWGGGMLNALKAVKTVE